MKGRTFRERSAEALGDARLGAAIARTADLLRDKRAAAVREHGDFEALRERGRAVKAKVAADLEGYAAEFTKSATRAGAVVHRAADGAGVAAILKELAQKHGLKNAVKAKSMTAEEIDFESLAHAAGVEVTETDLGEFIIQLAGEKPSHIMAPAIHRDRRQVAELFHEKLSTDPGLGVEELVAAARKYLRSRFLSADLGITGVNFAAADTGTLVLVTNEGNGRMTTSLPRVHIALAGLEKIVPALADVPDLLGLLARSASGQAISSYLTFVTGPNRPGDEEGPRELHIILLDNGRSAMAAGEYSAMLHCLHCGACLNHCPVYRAVGGHAWASPYPGPMGSVLSPLLWGLMAYPDLPDACTLCGRCREVCPMAIPLPDFHLRLRAENHSGERLPSLLAKVAARGKLYSFIIARFRSLLQRGLVPKAGKFAKGWSISRELPRPSDEPSFRKWWSRSNRGRKAP